MLKVGIIGSGFGLYGLLPAFHALKSCKVVAICGKKSPRLLSYCQKIGLDKIYTDWNLMLKREQPDVLALAVTPNAQYKIAKFAIKKGINIFAEKPLALNYQQAKELLKLAEENKIIHAIDFLYPEIPAWKKVKTLIDSKALGKLKHLYVNWDFPIPGIKDKRPSWKSNIQEGGGALSYYFCHSLYYIEYYCGEILSFKSNLSYEDEKEMGADIILKLKNGISGYAHLSCAGIGLNRHHLMFQFQKGAIILENENNTVTDFTIKILTEEKMGKLSLSREKVNDDEDERVRFVKRLASRFIDCCIKGKPLAPSFNEGVRVQWLIEQIRLSP